MNTRLQVEHPVTEMVTGFDLVEWQLRVAAGEPLPQQDEVRRGHAIEARPLRRGSVRAADARGRPRIGVPGAGAAAGVRIDHGIAEGGAVSSHYDAMVAKFIAHGRDRADAIWRLRAARSPTPAARPAPQRALPAATWSHADFRGATMTTTLIDEWFEREEDRAAPAVATPGASAAALLAHGAAGAPTASGSISTST